MAVGRRMTIEAHAQRLRAGFSEATPYLSRRQANGRDATSLLFLMWWRSYPPHCPAWRIAAGE
jgi:hypothetical protein